MSYLFFESVLMELGKKLNYDAIVNYAGNSFCEKSWDLIQEAYPMAEKKKTATSAIASFFENAVVYTRGSNDDSEALGPRKVKG